MKVLLSGKGYNIMHYDRKTLGCLGRFVLHLKHAKNVACLSVAPVVNE